MWTSKGLSTPCLVLTLAASVGGCQQEPAATVPAPVGRAEGLPAPEPLKLAEPTKVGEPAKRTSGLVYETLNEGTGPQARLGDTVTVHCIACGRERQALLLDTRSEPPATFQLSNPRLIQGWNEGIAGMEVGERRKLTVPPNLAYGAMGRLPVIPPNGTLILDIEVLAVGEPPRGPECPEPGHEIHHTVQGRHGCREERMDRSPGGREEERMSRPRSVVDAGRECNRDGDREITNVRARADAGCDSDRRDRPGRRPVLGLVPSDAIVDVRRSLGVSTAAIGARLTGSPRNVSGSRRMTPRPCGSWPVRRPAWASIPPHWPSILVSKSASWKPRTTSSWASGKSLAGRPSRGAGSWTWRWPRTPTMRSPWTCSPWSRSRQAGCPRLPGPPSGWRRRPGWEARGDLLLGMIRAADHDPAGAVEAFRRALERDPDHPDRAVGPVQHAEAAGPRAAPDRASGRGPRHLAHHPGRRTGSRGLVAPEPGVLAGGEPGRGRRRVGPVRDLPRRTPAGARAGPLRRRSPMRRLPPQGPARGPRQPACPDAPTRPGAGRPAPARITR